MKLSVASNRDIWRLGGMSWNDGADRCPSRAPQPESKPITNGCRMFPVYLGCGGSGKLDGQRDGTPFLEYGFPCGVGLSSP